MTSPTQDPVVVALASVGVRIGRPPLVARQPRRLGGGRLGTPNDALAHTRSNVPDGPSARAERPVRVRYR
jgi:hypothetical protein